MIEMTLPNEQVVSRVLGYCAEIDPDDLLDGEIVSPHLSLMEGLGQSVNASAVAAMLSRLPAIPVTLGRVRSYRHPGYDLLAIEAESDDLAKIHAAMVKHLPGGDECEYDPRIILCKLKAGCGKAYSGEDRFDGEVLTLGNATVCGQDGRRESVTLATPKKKVAFVGQEKPKHAEPLAKDSTVSPDTVEPLKVTPVKDPEPGPAPKEISLKSCWASLTREARDDLRRLRDRGTRLAIHKACRAIRHATGDPVARGLLTEWVTKKWVKDDSVTKPREGAKNERWVWEKEDGTRGSSRYFPKNEDPNAGRKPPREKPQGQTQQEGQEGEQQQKPAPEKKPGKARKGDPASVGSGLNAMLTGDVPVDLKVAVDMLMTISVKEMQKIAGAMDLKGGGFKSGKADKVAHRIAELALAGKLAEAAAEDESEGIELGGEPEQSAEQQAAPEAATSDDQGFTDPFAEEDSQPEEQSAQMADAGVPDSMARAASSLPPGYADELKHMVPYLNDGGEREWTPESLKEAVLDFGKVVANGSIPPPGGSKLFRKFEPKPPPPKDTPTPEGWKPSMDDGEAKQWAAGGKIDRPLYHVTTSGAGESIARDGFNTGAGQFGKVWGNGVYLASDDASADIYAKQMADPEKLTTYAKVEKPFTARVSSNSPGTMYEDVAKQMPGGLPAYQKALQAAKQRHASVKQEAEEKHPLDAAAQMQYMVDHGANAHPSAEAIQSVLSQAGHDALVIQQDGKPTKAVGGNQVVVFNPKQVTSVSGQPTTAPEAARPEKPAFKDRDRGKFRDNNETRVAQLPDDYEPNPGADADRYAELLESQDEPDTQGSQSREPEGPKHADPVKQRRAEESDDPVGSAHRLFTQGPKSGLSRQEAKESIARILPKGKGTSGLARIAGIVGVKTGGKKPAEVKAAIEQAILGKFPEEQAAPARQQTASEKHGVPPVKSIGDVGAFEDALHEVATGPMSKAERSQAIASIAKEAGIDPATLKGSGTGTVDQIVNAVRQKALDASVSHLPEVQSADDIEAYDDALEAIASDGGKSREERTQMLQAAARKAGVSLKGGTSLSGMIHQIRQGLEQKHGEAALTPDAASGKESATPSAPAKLSTNDLRQMEDDFSSGSGDNATGARLAQIARALHGGDSSLLSPTLFSQAAHGVGIGSGKVKEDGNRLLAAGLAGAGEKVQKDVTEEYRRKLRVFSGDSAVPDSPDNRQRLSQMPPAVKEFLQSQGLDFSAVKSAEQPGAEDKPVASKRVGKLPPVVRRPGGGPAKLDTQGVVDALHDATIADGGDPNASYPLLMRDLRRQLAPGKANKVAFDQAVMQAAEEGKVILHRHDHPLLLTDKERDELVKGDDGTYYTLASFRHGEATPRSGEATAKPAAKPAPAKRPADAPRGTGNWRPSRQQTTRQQKQEAIAAAQRARAGVDPAKRRMLEDAEPEKEYDTTPYRGPAPKGPPPREEEAKKPKGKRRDL